MTDAAADAGTPGPGTSILLCYDGSEGAKHAIAAAHEITGDWPATVLHLWEPPVGLMIADPFGGPPIWTAEQVSELDTVVRERAGRLLADGVRLAREAGFDATGQLDPSTGPAWRRIIEVGDELDAKAIVLGARGLSVVESAILGSVSNAVVHHAKRPVLVVPRLLS